MDGGAHIDTYMYEMHVALSIIFTPVRTICARLNTL